MAYVEDPRAPGEGAIQIFSGWIGSWGLSVQRRPLNAAEIARRYDREAPRWGDLLAQLGSPRAYERLLAASLAKRPALAAAGPLRALDCGAGDGALSLALARVAPRGVSADAVDLSPRMLAEARRRFAEAGLDAATQVADVRDLPYLDGSFDVVMAAHLLEHLADPTAALAEMARVLRPGGLMILCLTRRAALGVYIHLKWRTRLTTEPEALGLMRRAGLAEVEALRPDGGLFRRLTVACAGVKG
ncbi:MAG: class I SAM-dependent methyltransferase [Pseudomonadota bacterium]